MGPVKTVKTVCALCTDHCGIDVQVQDGQIIRVSGMREHPFHHLCVKPYALQELVYSKERVTTPLVKHKGTFKEISWEDAFDMIADKLTTNQRSVWRQGDCALLRKWVCLSLQWKDSQAFRRSLGNPQLYHRGLDLFFRSRDGVHLDGGRFSQP